MSIRGNGVHGFFESTQQDINMFNTGRQGRSNLHDVSEPAGPRDQHTVILHVFDNSDGFLNIDEIDRRMKKAGIPIVAPLGLSGSGRSRSMAVLDPNGIRVEMYEY